MSDKQSASQKAREFFEKIWSGGDYWEFESCPYEQARFDAMERVVSGRRYGRILEIGCGAGTFTRRLARHGDYVRGLDISESAIAKGRSALGDQAHIDLRVANVMEYDWRADPAWDLIVLAETVYYLGWLYPVFDVGWMASELREMTSPGGRLLLANTEGGCDDYLILPCLIQTYRDLYRNVGYAVEREDVFRGQKNSVELMVRMTLFTRPRG